MIKHKKKTSAWKKRTINSSTKCSSTRYIMKEKSARKKTTNNRDVTQIKVISRSESHFSSSARMTSKYA